MLTCQKHLFDLEKGVTYLNTAYMSPLLSSTQEVAIQGINRKLRPYNISDEDFFTEAQILREAFSQLVLNPDPERIALIPAVSYGIENAARNIPFAPGDEILTIQEQFPSNIYPWQEIATRHKAKIVTISVSSEEKERGKIWNQKILENIHARTKVVALPQVHWSEGILFDLQEIRRRTREIGAYLIIDGTQSVGAYPFSIEKIQPDALICATYKWLLGPYSFGLAYYGPRFDNGKPIENSWMNRLGSENFAGLVNYQSAFQPGAGRYNVGEQSNFVLIPMALHGIQKLLTWNPYDIQDYLKSIISPLELLPKHGFHLPHPDYRGNHLIGIKFPAQINPLETKELLKKHQVYASVRGNFLRVSPFLFNTTEDLEKLVALLQQLS